MIKHIFLLFLCSASLSILSCSKDEPEYFPPEDSDTAAVSDTSAESDENNISDESLTDSDGLDPDEDTALPEDKDTAVPDQNDDVIIPDDDVLADDFPPLQDEDNVQYIDEDLISPDADVFDEEAWKSQDEDEDGILNGEECPVLGQCVDSDGDGIPDYRDYDADGDGIPDSVEMTGDTDSDGVPDYRDTDADGDGINDGVEAGFDPESPVDSDDDGTPDYLDTDSDDDGISDKIEGSTDLDNDGIQNYLDLDSDGDGFTDAEEGNVSGNKARDTDGDKIPDFLDKDSDNDGLLDKREKELGTNPYNKDTDGDTYEDGMERATGYDPKNPASHPSPNNYYITLPYKEPEVAKQLDFSTTIKSADIMIQIDLSGSMLGEINNLKSGIQSTVIDGIRAEMANTAFGIGSFNDWRDIRYKLNQAITTDVNAVKAAVNSLGAIDDSGYETQIESIYQGVTGEGLTTKSCEDDQWGSESCTDRNIAAQNPAYRSDSLPILVMITDEKMYEATDYYKFKGTQVPHTMQQAINAMNAKKVKFIGIDSWDSDVGEPTPADQYATIGTQTGSVDKNGNPFKYHINSDGTGLSSQIKDAVIALAKNIQIDVTTQKASVANPEGVNTTGFILQVKPLSAVPGQGTGYLSMDATTFYKVTPGTTVRFDLRFKNDFFENKTEDTKQFKAQISVIGAGTILDTREVIILVPGVEDNG